MRRLDRILALRQVGLPLTEIDSVFNDEGPGLIETVGSHLERIDRDLERGQRLRQPLVRILDALERSLVEALGSPERAYSRPGARGNALSYSRTESGK